MVVKTVSAAVICCLVLSGVAVGAQVSDENRLLSLFAAVARNGDLSPDIEKGASAVMNSIPSMTTEEVGSAMPAIVAALSANDEPVQALAALACYGIARRPDASQLLASELPVIASLLESGSERVRSLAGLILASGRMTLGPEVMSRILAAINQRDRRVAERIPALAAAVRMAPMDPAVIDAATGVMLEPLDAREKAAVLMAIRVSPIDSVPLRSEVIGWLQDADVRVKLSAIAVLTRMGPTAIGDARFELQRITESNTEADEVRAEAEKALQMSR